MDKMTIEAWVFMSLAWLLVIGGTVYCFAKLLSLPPPSQDDDPEGPIPPESPSTAFKEGPASSYQQGPPP